MNTFIKGMDLSTLPEVERCGGKFYDNGKPGDAVSIYIKSIHPERCKLKLTVLRRLDTAPAPKPLHYFRTAGSTAGWCYKAPSAIHPFLS